MEDVDRIREAWRDLPGDIRASIEPTVAAGHAKVLASRRGTVPEPDASTGHAAYLIHSAVNGDDIESGQFVHGVDKSGQIWGDGKFEEGDIGWLKAGAGWLEGLLRGKHPFNISPAVIQIPDEVKIALAGDWGTGDWRLSGMAAPSTKVQRSMMLLQPHVTIHLGDVYYSGTVEEEKTSLQSFWPRGAIGSFALNSNHEMYGGAHGYFGALADLMFGLQRGCSYFALENSHWVIVGLDSAYYAPEHKLFLDGALSPEQVSFLATQAAKGKRVIVLTHHNGLTQDGSKTHNLWEQVQIVSPDYWYWGHVHCAAVYAPREGTRCRCCGHGGLPFGKASALAGKSTVVWYEARSSDDPTIPLRILNGFTEISLSGPDIEERFYDENGLVAWSSS